MYDSLTGQNAYLLRLDPERLAAHRQEIKRALAEIAVKKTRRDELRDIIRKLQADSDRAADDHSAATAGLQTELDRLDEQQVECVLAGKATPEKSVKRRREILDELTELNKNLEATCAANKRAAVPIQRQINGLVDYVAAEQPLRNQLVALCSDQIRLALALNDIRMRMASAGIKDLERQIPILEHNARTYREQHNHSGAAIKDMQIADMKTVVEALNAEIITIRAASADLIAEAIDE